MATKQSKNITAGGQMNQPKGGHTIILTQANHWHKDIADYMQAVNEGERIDFPSRVKLYDMYSTILMDTHLSAVLTKRKSAILSTQMEFSRDGKPDEMISEMIESPWFRSFLTDLLDTIWWGNSLFQFRYDKGGWPTYDLIPRKHIDPIRQEIIKMQHDLQGTPWDHYPNLFYVGSPRSIGELVKAIPWVLYKRGTTADWAQYAEIFGHPIREYIYDATDDEERRRVIKDAYETGASTVYIHPRETNLNLIEAGGKSGSSELYSKFVEVCNSELSKLVLGNTLTTESSARGTQALGTVHQSEEERIKTADKIYILNILNYEMTDLFENLGINTRGGKFNFVTPQVTDSRTQYQIVKGLSEMGLPMSSSYLYDQFGVERPKDNDDIVVKQTTVIPDTDPKKTPVIPDADPESPKKAGSTKKKKKAQKQSADDADADTGLLNRIHRFFAQAPFKFRKGAHLDY